MKSFRHELEDIHNPVVEKDILELEQKIAQFKGGQIPEEKFRSLRLARGVYGQRQPGVQMVRIKIPFGKLSTAQLRRISEVSDTYSNGNLHLTTRQDIQIHHVSLDETPRLWAELEKDQITLREACGNTVRNITASYTAGIDPEEPFDVSPYAYALFDYFLRYPACQELGRKIKIAFSSSDRDDAFTFMHDLGFIPKIQRNANNESVRGFKVVVGGGLGAQPFLAQTAFEFLEEDRIIPFTDAVLRVFDRYGERNKRQKARLKFLLDEIGLEALLQLVAEEEKALPHQRYTIDSTALKIPVNKQLKKAPFVKDLDIHGYDAWLKTNVFEQKQTGYFAVRIQVLTGDLSSDTARALASLVENYAADDIRLTIDQGILLKYILPENLPYLFTELKSLGLERPGAGSTADITTCPGTDTCNLGITSSYGMTRELEKVIAEEYPQLLHDQDLRIKISGCMNSCGQHGIAGIGFHGSTLRANNLLAPAVQILLGGQKLGNGNARIADKVIKIPVKRGPQALRILLNDFLSNKNSDENFTAYYLRKEEKYFYDLLKPLASTENLQPSDFIDWGSEETYKQAIGVGECAGVAIDLIATLLFETEEKLDNARRALEDKKYADSIYFSYATFISGAKTWLVEHNKKTNSHHGIIADFQTEVESGNVKLPFPSFRDTVFQIRAEEPSPSFAKAYLQQAEEFYQLIKTIREPKTVSNHVTA
jgi:sulfite reductase (ferredoxin)